MKRSWAVCILAALVIAAGMATMAEEDNPAPAQVPAAQPKPAGIKPELVLIHHAKASHVAAYLQEAIAFAESVGTNQVLKGKSKALPDDRTNQIILLTANENLPFFGRIIHALDVPVHEPPAPPAPPARPPAQPQTGVETKDAP